MLPEPPLPVVDNREIRQSHRPIIGAHFSTPPGSGSNPRRRVPSSHRMAAESLLSGPIRPGPPRPGPSSRRPRRTQRGPRCGRAGGPALPAHGASSGRGPCPRAVAPPSRRTRIHPGRRAEQPWRDPRGPMSKVRSSDMIPDERRPSPGLREYARIPRRRLRKSGRRSTGPPRQRLVERDGGMIRNNARHRRAAGADGGDPRRPMLPIPRALPMPGIRSAGTASGG